MSVEPGPRRVGCPFPGMDPFLERAELWPDFHDTLITVIKVRLQPLLRPKYAAITQDRLWVVESERPIRPDLTIVRRNTPEAGAPPSPDPMPDRPVVIELEEEEVREPLIHIIEPAAGNRLVTALEILSPDNKAPGPGRTAYLRKRDEVRAARANLVEVDLLRDGRRTLRVAEEGGAADPKLRYLVAVSRCQPARYELYRFGLADRLPRVAVPLLPEDRDIVLDLQAAFREAWDAGAYPELLRYAEPPPGSLEEDERELCARSVQGMA